MARPSRCVFCGSDQLNKEHLWSDWMRDLLVDKSVVLPHRQELPSGKVHEWPAPPFTATVRCVCRTCNSGWMSDIENAAKPHLTPLIRANPRILSTRAQAAIAAWMYLKVLMFSQWREVPGVHEAVVYREFFESRTPSTTARISLAGYHADGSLAHFTYRSVGLTGPSGAVVDPDVSRAQLATLVVNHAVLQLFSHRLSEQIDYAPAEMYAKAAEPIWPTRMPFSWPWSLMNHAALEEFMTPHGRATPSTSGSVARDSHEA